MSPQQNFCGMRRWHRKRWLGILFIPVISLSSMPSAFADSHELPASSLPINGRLETVGADRAGALATLIPGNAGSGQRQPLASPLRQGAPRPLLPWLLPMNGPVKLAETLVKTASRIVLNPAKPEELKGGISLSNTHDAIGQRIDQLLDAALDKDDKTHALDKAVAHYRTTTQKVVAEAKDATDYLVPYRGFGPSSEAGDIILGEKIKLKSRASAEYARQKHIDETHVKVVSSVMQIAMGLGMSDRTRGADIASSGMTSLKELVGEEEAAKTMELLSAWGSNLVIPESIYSQPVWDVSQRQTKCKTVMESSLQSDPVVQEIVRRLHTYNQRSNFARASAKVVQTTLGVAALTPNFVGPAAKLALLTFVMATGGPEQCKLLKELYLDKRFESRWKVINEEAHLALENYQLALLTRNPILLACSESVVRQMIGPESVAPLLGASILSPEIPAPSDSDQPNGS